MKIRIYIPMNSIYGQPMLRIPRGYRFVHKSKNAFANVYYLIPFNYLAILYMRIYYWFITLGLHAKVKKAIKSRWS